MSKKQEYRRVMVALYGYAIVPGNTDEEALENTGRLTRDDFDWECFGSGVLEAAEVIETCERSF